MISQGFQSVCLKPKPSDCQKDLRSRPSTISVVPVAHAAKIDPASRITPQTLEKPSKSKFGSLESGRICSQLRTLQSFFLEPLNFAWLCSYLSLSLSIWCWHFKWFSSQWSSHWELDQLIKWMWYFVACGSSLSHLCEVLMAQWP